MTPNELKKNLAFEKSGEIMMFLGIVLFIGLVTWGGIVWQKSGRESAAEIAICKLVKAEFLKPNACGEK